ncbi:MAG TPA: hypothetical protein VGQ81_13460 [Acidobacteriota bacterium]|nr:hypothetical protein [Acidobacteriota bacterium]
MKYQKNIRANAQIDPVPVNLDSSDVLVDVDVSVAVVGRQPPPLADNLHFQ